MRYIDLRSDTVTMPTAKMRQAIAAAPVGDDIYGDDPTMNLFEEKAAALIGKERAIFVPSGTMGNQVCIMTHTNRGEEIIVEENAHIVQHERAAIAVLSSVMPRAIRGTDSIMDLADVKKAIRPVDVHKAHTSLICLENALSNGMVAPLSYMKEIYELAQSQDLKVHLDGARLFNAATYLKCDVKELTQYTDSVTFCVSKGLCAPVGAIVAGTKAFIEEAINNRKMLGGGLRQSGILAAAGMIAMEEMSGRLDEDHENALYMADKLLALGCRLNKFKIHINMVFFTLPEGAPSDDIFVNKMLEHGIKINHIEEGLYRFVTNNDINRENIDYVASCIEAVLS